jgi:hypothetical protein
MSDTRARTPQPPDIGRRTLTPFGYAVCVAVPILIAALGFAYLHFHYDKEDLVSGQRIPILTSASSDISLTNTLIKGELVLGADGCMRLGVTDGTEVTLVWPADYEATMQHVGQADQLKVYDPDRNIVARSSQTLEIGGLYAEAGEYAGRSCAPGSGEVFVVQSEVKVVGNS